MIKNPQQRLALNGLVLSQGGGAVTHDGGFKLEALSTDSDFGDPEPIVSTLETELEDGERLQLDGYGNRELFFQVRVTAADAQGLALGEKALAGVSRPGELSWLPPAVAGSETFYDVELCHLVWLWDDVDELRVTRVYGLQITAQPFGRTAEPVVIPAAGSGDPTPPPAPVETVINDCTSTAGWTHGVTLGASSSSLTVVGGNLRLAAVATEDTVILWAQLAVSVDMSSTPLLGVESDGHVDISFNGSSSHAPRLARIGSVTYVAAPPSVTSIRISSAFLTAPIGSTVSTLLKRVFRTDAMPYSGTARQLFRSFETHGTARTSGTMRLSHQAALGSVLVWSGVDGGTGYQPPMRRFKSGGGADLADTDAASGARTNISTSPFEVEVPVDQLPDGLYRVAGRVKADTAGEAFFTRTYTTVGSPLASFTPESKVTPPHNLTTDYRIVDLGTEMISGSYGSSLSRRMTVQATGAGTGTVWLDELYLLNTSTGAVVQVEAGAAKHVWINAPTVATPFPTLLGGVEADGSDAVRLDPVADIFQPAAWSPGTINLFTACGQPNLAAEAEYYPRFLHNAYEVVL